MTTAAKIQKLTAASKSLLKQLPSDVEMKKTLAGLSSSTDQSIALIGASYLNYALQVLLSARLSNLEKKDDYRRMFDSAGNGILGTTSNKIKMAYALELVDNDTYNALLLMNDIRNVFAHALHLVDFNNALVREDCDKLYRGGPATLSAKEKYLNRAETVYANLLATVEYQARERERKTRRLIELSKARSALGEIGPKLEPAGKGLIGQIKKPHSSYGTSLGPLGLVVDKAEKIVKGLYPAGDRYFPPALSMYAEARSLPVGIDASSIPSGRLSAARKAHGAVAQIRKMISRVVEATLLEERMLKVTLAQKWLPKRTVEEHDLEQFMRRPPS